MADVQEPNLSRWQRVIAALLLCLIYIAVLAAIIRQENAMAGLGTILFWFLILWWPSQLIWWLCFKIKHRNDNDDTEMPKPTENELRQVGMGPRDFLHLPTLAIVLVPLFVFWPIVFTELAVWSLRKRSR